MAKRKQTNNGQKKTDKQWPKEKGHTMVDQTLHRKLRMSKTITFASLYK